MSLAAELELLRTRVGLAESRHVQVLRLDGGGAFEALEAVLPTPLHLQDAQLKFTLLLDDRGAPWADVQLARDDEAFFLLLETAPEVDALAVLADRIPGDLDVELRSLAATHALWSLHGPWAWELVGEVLGPDVMGQPYLSLQQVGDVTCFRSGKTGEFGYDLLVPREQEEALLARVRERGRAFGLGPVSLAALDEAALENWFFSIRFDGLRGLTPLELQLQWRLGSRQAWRGASALAARRAEGLRSRVCMVRAARGLAEGDEVFVEGRRIGRVVVAGRAPRPDDGVGWALLDLPWALAGVPLRIGTVEARTVAPPACDNLSLRVDPHRHSYRHGRLP